MNHPEHNVEMIMKVFSRFSDKCIQDLATPEYNAVYSHVAKCLLTIHEKLQQRLSTAEAALELERQSVNELSLHCQEVEAELDRLRAENERHQAISAVDRNLEPKCNPPD